MTTSASLASGTIIYIELSFSFLALYLVWIHLFNHISVKPGIPETAFLMMVHGIGIENQPGWHQSCYSKMTANAKYLYRTVINAHE